MITAGSLSPETRAALLRLARSGKAEHRVARRANVLVLLDAGKSYAEIAEFLLLDDQTIRDLERLFERDGIDAISRFHHRGSACELSQEQRAALTAWITKTHPRSTNAVGAWIERRFGIAYQSRSGLIALLHRLDMVYRKPETISRKLDPVKQAAFIKAYETLLNGLAANETVLFGDAVHPTHLVRPVGCWTPKDVTLAVEQSSGRQRLNVHGAVDLETGKTCMLDCEAANAASTIALLTMIEAAYPHMRVVHLFLDNARYHHAKDVDAWLNRPGCRIKLHFIPPYCPHLAPIERLWGLMHKHVTHNRCYETFAQFKTAVLTFLQHTVPARWQTFCDTVTDNFRVISPSNFRKIA